jgi:hypothetical protein
MAFKQNNPLSRKTSPINRDWIKGAIKRPGAFRKKAEEAGMSTKAFADKVIANKEDYSARTGKQAELAETLMGMSRHESGHYENPEQGDFDYEDPNYKNTKEYKRFERKQKRNYKKFLKDREKDVDDKGRKRGEAGFQQDEEEARYEGMSRHEAGHLDSTNVEPLISEIKGSSIEKVEGEKPKLEVKPPKKKLTQADLDKAKSTAKSAGHVDASGREGTNRQERKKRRQERRSIRKKARKGELSQSQKQMALKESRQQQKDNVRGVKKEGVSRKNCKYKK